jgi:hypothetical protein
MAGDVLDPDQGFFRHQGQTLGGAQPDQQGADQTGAAGRGDHVDVVKLNPAS